MGMKRRAGRPSQGKRTNFHLQLTADELAAFTALGERFNVERTTLVRQLIRAACDMPSVFTEEYTSGIQVRMGDSLEER